MSLPLPLNSKERQKAVKNWQFDQVHQWRVSIFVTPPGQVETCIGSKIVLGHELAMIEARKMESRQPATLSPRSFVGPV